MYCAEQSTNPEAGNRQPISVGYNRKGSACTNVPK